MPSFGSVGDGLDNAIDENYSGQVCTSSYSTPKRKEDSDRVSKCDL
jgi:hypothetical protein